MNYDIYHFSKGEKILYPFIGIILDAAVSWAFFRSRIVFLVLLFPMEYVFIKYIKKSLIEKRKYELALEFREAIMAVQSSLNAGYSVENSFIEAGRVMENIYGESPIVHEFRILTRRLRSNENLEKILSDMADRSGIEDIEDFASVFAAAKRSGGDYTKIIRKASETIADKIDVLRDIRTGISAKRYENRIMEAVPFGIILYLSITSSEFLSPLYHNFSGIIVMTISLALYAAGFVMAEKITMEAEKV